MNSGNWFYLFLVLCIFFASAITLKMETHVKELLSYIFVISISLTIGLRSFESGTDTRAYVDHFNNIDNGLNDFEIGYELLTFAFSGIGDARLFLILICLLTLALLIFAAKSLQINQLILLSSILSFVHGFDLLTNGIRNGLGVSLTIFIIVATVPSRGYGLASTVASALGGLIHLSSLIFPLFKLILWKFFYSKKVLWFLYLTALAALILMGDFAIDRILNFALLYVDGAGFSNKAARYILLDEELLKDRVKYYFLAVGAFICFVNLAFYDSLTNEPIRLLARIGVLGFLVSSCLFFSAFSYRLFMLFFFPQIMVFSHILSLKISFKWRLILLTFLTANFIITYSTSSFAKMNLLHF